MITQADARVYAATLHGAQQIDVELVAGRKAWVQVARGSLKVNGAPLERGDGLAIDGSGHLTLSDGEAAEILYFDLAQ